MFDDVPRPWRRLCALGLLMAAALLMVTAGRANAATPTELYAYAAGGATDTASSCPQTATVASRCTLQDAIAVADASAGNATIYLESTGTYPYESGTVLDPSANVTIEPDAGVSATLAGAGETTQSNYPVIAVSGGDVSFSGNTANGGSLTFSGASAGALATSGSADVTVTGVTFSDNSNGYLLQVLNLGNEAVGGAINDEATSGTLTVTDSVFSKNATTGGLAQALGSNQDSGGAIFIAGGQASISGSEFNGNNNQGDIQAVADVYNGGAVALTGGTLNVTDSTFNGNYSLTDIASVSLGSDAVNGGAIANIGGTLDVSTSTFSANYVNPGLASIALAGIEDNGGAIFTHGASSTTTVAQSTFSGNYMTGGINIPIGTVAGEGQDLFNDATTNVAANIFADSCYNSGTITDSGYNVAIDGSCENGGGHDVANATTSTLALGALQNNGGPTETMAPGATSVGAGVIPSGTSVSVDGASVTLCPTTDQRGVASSGDCNAGSVQNGSAGSAPSNTGPPSITGTVGTGSTVTCDPGTWSGSPQPTLTYQWYLNGNPIANATASSYLIPSGDAGDTLTCTVTATNNNGSSSATSPGQTVSGTTSGAAPFNTTKPTISGTVAGGKTVTCTTGTWTGSPTPTFTYQWYLDGAAIPGATGSSYNVPVSQEGETLSCAVTATNSSGAASSTSAGVKIPVPVVKHCPAAGGSLSGMTVGKVHLGETMTAAKAAYPGDEKGRDTKGFIVCFQPRGMRVEHPTSKLLKAMPAKDRGHWKSRAVLIMTNSAHYSFRGVRPTTLWSTAKKDFKFVAHYLVNGDHYYVIKDGSADVILKVRGRTVYGIGVSVAALQQTKTERSAYTSQYWSNP